MTLPLYASDGKTPLSPTVALDLALQDGPIEERHLMQLATEYADPNIVTHTLERLGAIRVRQDDGTVVVTLPQEQDFKFAVMPGATDKDGEGYPIPPTKATGGSGKVITSEGSATMAVHFADHRSRPAFGTSALDNWETAGGDLIPLREATRQGVSVGDIGIVHRGAERFVRKPELDAFLAKRSRSNPAGAGTKVANAIGKAQQQRAADSAVQGARRGRQAGREYRQIKSDQIIRESRRY